MPAVRSASDWMRRSRSWYVTLRREKYRTTAKTATLRMSAVAYQMVNRPRMLSTLRAHHVTHAAHRMDQLGLAALIDLLPEARDHDVHDVRAGIEVVIPGVLGDQRARHHAPVMPHQILEDRVLLRRELDPFAVARHLAAAGVEREPGDLQRGRSDFLRPAAERFDPRQ